MILLLELGWRFVNTSSPLILILNKNFFQKRYSVTHGFKYFTRAREFDTKWSWHENNARVADLENWIPLSYCFSFPSWLCYIFFFMSFIRYKNYFFESLNIRVFVLLFFWSCLFCFGLGVTSIKKSQCTQQLLLTRKSCLILSSFFFCLTSTQPSCTYFEKIFKVRNKYINVFVT